MYKITLSSRLLISIAPYPTHITSGNMLMVDLLNKPTNLAPLQAMYVPPWYVCRSCRLCTPESSLSNTPTLQHQHTTMYSPRRRKVQWTQGWVPFDPLKSNWTTYHPAKHCQDSADYSSFFTLQALQWHWPFTRPQRPGASASTHHKAPTLVGAPIPDNVPPSYICPVKCSWVVRYRE